MPSSFASAAAGQADGSSRRASGRTDGSTFGEWSRRPNGATQTFRRSSFATTTGGQSSQPDTANNSMNQPMGSGTYQPPHTFARNGLAANARYTRDQLLSCYTKQKDAGELVENLADLFIGEFDMDNSNGLTDKKSRRDEHGSEAAPRPDVCLNYAANTEPLGLVEMTAEETELFTSSINSPLKAPNQNVQRDTAQRDGVGIRKMSLSQGQGLANVSSPLSARLPRRDTSESHPWLRDSVTSPQVSKYGREDVNFDPQGSLARRNTESKDAELGRYPMEKERENRGHNSRSSFGPPRRVSTGPLSAGVGANPSPWSQSSANPFGGFGLHNGTAAQGNRPGGGLVRGESKFRGFMSRDAGGESDPTIQEQTSQGSLKQLSETEPENMPSSHPIGDFDQFTAHDRNAITHEGMPAGSAALRGGLDDSFAQAFGQNEYGRSSRQTFLGHATSSGFPTSQDAPSYQSWTGHRPQTHQHDSSANMQPGEEPLSPTFTNPYQSPKRPTSKPVDAENSDMDFNSFHLPGLGSLPDDIAASLPQTAGTIPRTSAGYDARPFDRGPGFGNGPSRAFPGLGGLGGLPSIPTAAQRSSGLGSGIPSRERMLEGFGDQSSRQDNLQTTSFTGLGNVGSYASPSQNDRTPGLGRGSRLGSLFPSGMQDQMRAPEPPRQRRAAPGDFQRSDENYDPFASRAPGHSFHPSAGPSGDTNSPPRYMRGQFDDMGPGQSAELPMPIRSQYSPGQSSQQLPPIGSQASLPHSHNEMDQNQHQGPPGMSNASIQPPAAQQKTMVMPDRIRWIYRDPQGNTQGPWSGLEMHDWYRAGFFSPELLVKKAEDTDYEPLAQLIRRIGNSREPFLVPQIGIPGPPSTASTNTWPTQAAAPPTAPSTAPAAQPPFASSFPSFGTTLTAEQQNALERRKQEEQYLMARQKEHLAQQQVLAKQMQMQSPHSAHQQPLQHHSSAHSLQSQPSYGSITSPSGYQATPTGGHGPIQPNHGSFDSTIRHSHGGLGSTLETLGDIEEEALAQDIGRMAMDTGEQRHQSDSRYSQGPSQHQTQLSGDGRMEAMLDQRNQLRQEQALADGLQPNDDIAKYGRNDRLQQFHELREQHRNDATGGNEALQERQQRKITQNSKKITQDNITSSRYVREEVEYAAKEHATNAKHQNLTLTEQVQQAASAKQSPTIAAQSPWAKVDRPMTESHPVSQTSSPLPAPAARRSGGQSVADALAAGSSSGLASPVLETPSASIAPWAKESADAPKQPSLKQIQEAEARRAAKYEEVQLAMRRAALEKEYANQPVAPAPGLPSSANWASGDSLPSPSLATTSAWAKATSSKPATVPGKKTLQQIQKEEEALAKRRKALNAASTGTGGDGSTGVGPAVPAGKRYAQLASIATGPSPGVVAASAWTTVGSSGKPKTPATPSMPTQPPRNATSDNAVSATTTTKAKPPMAPVRTNTSGTNFNAQDEFKKWAVGEVRPDLKKGIQVDEFMAFLYDLPSDTELITEAVHSSSSTMDSRHFAEEFVRRRALADKGKPQPPSGTSAPANHSAAEGKSGGWSEVARKGPVSATKEESNAFKVVPSKKKGGKR